MNRQVFNFMKQRNEKAQPSLQRLEKIAGEPRKELSQDSWGFPGAWDPRDMQQNQDGIKTGQGGMPRNTKNKNRYVFFSHLRMQKRGSKGLGTNNA